MGRKEGRKGAEKSQGKRTRKPLERTSCRRKPPKEAMCHVRCTAASFSHTPETARGGSISPRDRLRMSSFQKAWLPHAHPSLCPWANEGTCLWESTSAVPPLLWPPLRLLLAPFLLNSQKRPARDAHMLRELPPISGRQTAAAPEPSCLNHAWK